VDWEFENDVAGAHSGFSRMTRFVISVFVTSAVHSGFLLWSPPGWLVIWFSGCFSRRFPVSERFLDYFSFMIGTVQLLFCSLVGKFPLKMTRSQIAIGTGLTAKGEILQQRLHEPGQEQAPC